MKWERLRSGTYSLGDYRIRKAANGKITKSFGYDVYKKIERLKHFNTLKEAKAYVEGLMEV